MRGREKRSGRPEVGLRSAAGHLYGEHRKGKIGAHGSFARVRDWGVAKLVKAADFDSAIRGFESFLPSP